MPYERQDEISPLKNWSDAGAQFRPPVPPRLPAGAAPRRTRLRSRAHRNGRSERSGRLRRGARADEGSRTADRDPLQQRRARAWWLPRARRALSSAGPRRRRHRHRRQSALQLPVAGVDRLQRPPRAAWARLAEMLLASMPRYAGPDRPQILREVWPLTLTARESDGPCMSPGIRSSAVRLLAPLDRKVRR